MNLMRRQLGEAITVETAVDGRFEASFSLPPGFVGFQGHFPSNPVMPGVCMVAAGIVCVERALGRAARMTRLTSAKFASPVRPGERVDVRGEISPEAHPSQVKVSLAVGGRKVARILFDVELNGGLSQE